MFHFPISFSQILPTLCLVTACSGGHFTEYFKYVHPNLYLTMLYRYVHIYSEPVADLNFAMYGVASTSQRSSS